MQGRQEDANYTLSYEDAAGNIHYNHVRADPRWFEKVRDSPIWRESLKQDFANMGFNLLSVQYYERVEFNLTMPRLKRAVIVGPTLVHSRKD